MQSESFKIYEEDFYKKEEPTFKIYEDKLEEETSVALRNSKENKEIKETIAKSEKEQPRLEIHTIDNTSTYAFCNKIKEVDQKKKDDILSKDSPMSLGMSLEKSLTYSSSSNEEYRLRRECNKELRINIFDVDEYRADIYNYLRTSEVYACFYSINLYKLILNEMFGKHLV